jgi:hypothetical protein
MRVDRMALVAAIVSPLMLVQPTNAFAACINTEKSCSAVLAFCLHRTKDSAADCRATYARCMKDGSWHSAYCTRDGLIRR